jgi:hypothetical protein
MAKIPPLCYGMTVTIQQLAKQYSGEVSGTKELDLSTKALDLSFRNGVEKSLPKGNVEINLLNNQM